MRVILDHFGITSGPLCGNFGYIMVLFKNIHFPIYFKDFINSSGHFAIDLGSFGGHFGGRFSHMGGLWSLI